MSDNNLDIPGGSKQDISLGESTSFIVQNTSNSKLGFKLKTSGEEVEGGEIDPGQATKFASSIMIWTTDKANASVYILRS